MSPPDGSEDTRPLKTGGAIRALEATHLLRPAYRFRRRLRTLRYVAERRRVVAGLPTPPARLRFLVGDNPDVRDFIVGGRLAAELIEARLRALGIAMESLGAFLDFGCGCGRIARHWASLSGPEIHGSDANPELIAWCAKNLPFVRCASNGLEPPLRYADDTFDLVYAFSVLTHLPPDVGQAWITELRRILAPDGILMLTHHGDRQATLLDGEARERYASGNPVSLREALTGTNGCSTFAPPSYVRNGLLSEFDLLDFVPAGDSPGTSQDLYIARL